MTRYIIAIVIKGQAKRKHCKLTKELSKKFEIKNVSERIDPHITLKDLGEIDNKLELNNLKKIIKDFAKNEKKFEINFSQIGNFRERVVFMDIKKTKDLVNFYKRFYKKISELKHISIQSRYEGKNMHFHATLGGEDIEPKFKEIRKYLSREKIEFSTPFNEIVIMKRTKYKLRPWKSRWRAWKTFKLK